MDSKCTMGGTLFFPKCPAPSNQVATLPPQLQNQLKLVPNNLLSSKEEVPVERSRAVYIALVSFQQANVSALGTCTGSNAWWIPAMYAILPRRTTSSIPNEFLLCVSRALARTTQFGSPACLFLGKGWWTGAWGSRVLARELLLGRRLLFCWCSGRHQ